MLLLKKKKLVNPLYNPMNNTTGQKFHVNEAQISSSLITINKTMKKPYEMFLLNHFIRGIGANDQMKVVLQHFYGLGVNRSLKISLHADYFFDGLQFKNLTVAHSNFFGNLLKKAHLRLFQWLKVVKKLNVRRFNVTLLNFLNKNSFNKQLLYSLVGDNDVLSVYSVNVRENSKNYLFLIKNNLKKIVYYAKQFKKGYRLYQLFSLLVLGVPTLGLVHLLEELLSGSFSSPAFLQTEANYGFIYTKQDGFTLVINLAGESLIKPFDASDEGSCEEIEYSLDRHGEGEFKLYNSSSLLSLKNKCYLFITASCNNDEVHVGQVNNVAAVVVPPSNPSVSIQEQQKPFGKFDEIPATATIGIISGFVLGIFSASTFFVKNKGDTVKFNTQLIFEKEKMQGQLIFEKEKMQGQFKIDEGKLQLEKEKFEFDKQKFKIDEGKLQLEREKFEFDKQKISKNEEQSLDFTSNQSNLLKIKMVNNPSNLRINLAQGLQYLKNLGK